MLAAQLPHEERRDDPHPQHRGQSRARQTPEVHENRHRDGAGNHTCKGEIEGLAGVLHAAHPAVASHVDEGKGNRDGGDTQPLGRPARRIWIASQPHREDAGEEPHGDSEHHPHAHGNPRCLHALSHGLFPLTCTE